MEFTIAIGMWAVIGLIVGSVVLGVGIQLFGTPTFGYEWLVTAIVGGVGAFAASEFVVGFRTWEPLFDGLALIPAVLAGIVFGVIAAAALRVLTTDSYGTRTAA
jgi:hypothetical protein